MLRIALAWVWDRKEDLAYQSILVPLFSLFVAWLGKTFVANSDIRDTGLYVIIGITLMCSCVLVVFRGRLQKSFKPIDMSERRKAVQLIEIFFDARTLENHDPQVTFLLIGINASESEICLHSATGRMKFGNQEMSGSVGAEMMPHTPEPIKRFGRFAFLLSQFVSKEAAQQIIAPEDGQNHIAFNLQKVRVFFEHRSDKGSAQPNLYEVELPANVQVSVKDWKTDLKLTRIDFPTALNEN